MPVPFKNTDVGKYLDLFSRRLRQLSLRDDAHDFPDYQKPAMNWRDYRARLGALVEEYGVHTIDSEEMDRLLKQAVLLLEDGHSVYLGKNRGQAQSPKDHSHHSCGQIFPGHNAAYLYIPHEMFSDREQSMAFSRQLRELIIALDQGDPSGWIIDLRGSLGGSMWGTLGALSPLLPREPAGEFYRHNKELRWAWDLQSFEAYSDLPAYCLKNPELPVAVLTGSLTSSAGEALAVAFRGLPHVKSFGAKTDGRSTGNITFPLAHGRAIALAFSFYADRLGRVYGGPITPDFKQASTYDAMFNPQAETIHSFTPWEEGFDPEKDSLVIQAAEWINGWKKSSEFSLDYAATPNRS